MRVGPESVIDRIGEAKVESCDGRHCLHFTIKRTTRKRTSPMKRLIHSFGAEPCRRVRRRTEARGCEVDRAQGY